MLLNDFGLYLARVLNGTVLQNIYSVDIVNWLSKSAEQSMNLYKSCKHTNVHYGNKMITHGVILF